MRRRENPNHGRFLTFSCQHRLPLFSNDAIKDAFVDQLIRTRDRYGFLLFAWVIMPEHVHLVARFPGGSTATTVLRALKSAFARRVIARWRELDASVISCVRDSRHVERFWLPGGGYDRNLISLQQIHEKARYVHLNPVRRGLVERPEQWAWSSARWWAGDRESGLTCDQP
ncbi:MAG: hypothetical protein CMJ31_11200 [Phycisphaerae bacterium]|nr:hypothetical protein [Phycisphaerae bacterium]